MKQYFTKLDENDIGSDCERTVEGAKYLRQSHAHANGSGQFFKCLLPRPVRSAWVIDLYVASS